MRLPASFAAAALITEEVSEAWLRIRRAQVIPEDEGVFAEAVWRPLSPPDTEIFQNLLESSPPPNEAL